jgi:hypothetical protein
LLLVLFAGSSLATANSKDGLPPTKISVIKSIYPDLHARELRRQPVSWNHLRKMAAHRWRGTHKCATPTLRYFYQHGLRSSWKTMLATWRCDDVPQWKVRFMSCIPRYEGGYGEPDITFGSYHALRMGIAWLRSKGNIVLGHLQLRPAWYRGAMNGHPGRYELPDRWDGALLEFAVDPVNQARATAPLSTSQYATVGFCA